jgi:hypothetical protein
MQIYPQTENSPRWKPRRLSAATALSCKKAKFEFLRKFNIHTCVDKLTVMSRIKSWQILSALALLVLSVMTPMEAFSFQIVKAAEVAPTIEWQQSYGGDIESVSNVVQTSDGGYAFIDYGWGHQTTMVPSTIYKVDSSGNVTWLKSINYWRAGEFIQTNDDGLEVFGRWSTYGTTYKYTPMVVKFDSEGNVQWTENKTNSFDPFDSVIFTSDGGFASFRSLGSLTQYQEISGGIVTKTSSHGVLEWNKTYSEPANYSKPDSMIQTSDGGYALIGSTSFNGEKDTPNLYYWLIKVDAAGNREWSREFGSGPETVDTNQTQNAGALDGLNRRTFGDNEGISVMETSDGGFVVGGVMYPVRDYSWWGFSYSTNPEMVKTVLIKVDLNGTTEWTKSYDGYETSPIIHTSDDGLAFAIYGAIIKTTVNGDVQWEKEVTYPNRYGSNPFSLEIVSLIETSDGAFVAIGTGSGTAPSWQGDIYLIKTEPCLPVPTATQTPPPPIATETYIGTLFSMLTVTIVIGIAAISIITAVVAAALLRKRSRPEQNNAL